MIRCIFRSKSKYMLKKYAFLSLLLIIGLFGHAQQMPIDFSNSNHQFTGFSGSGFSIQPGPIDGNNQTGQFFNDGSTADQGFFIDLTREIDLSSQQNIDLRFYAFDPIAHTVKIKLEVGNGDPDVEVIANVASGNANTWQDLSFDFSNAQLSSNGTPIDATGTYNRLTIFIDFGSTQAGTYRIDDITDGSTATDPNELDIIYNDLVWSDEFDTDGAVDDTKWHHQTFGPNGGQWFNGELQHYTDSQDNSFVSGGFLNIVAKRETTNQNGITLDFTSARLNSKYAFTYGRVDVRAKLPLGEGTWPAIWTLGKNVNEQGAWFQTQGFGTTSWPACGEIDIMEHGLHATNVVSSAIHTPSSSGATVNTDTFSLADVANNFHVYSVNWSPNQITFLIDGVGYYTYKPAVQDASTWPFDLDQFLLLNIAMGGFAGTVDPGFTQSSMQIDYVRVYQNNPLSTTDVFADKFTLYPNPSNDEGIFNIRTTEQIDKIELYNTLGQLMINKSSNPYQMDVQDVASGMYIMKIYSGNRSTTKKVMIR
jgi:beta-glucanase (GH16 family)